MPALFSYLLKANIALTLFFLTYYFGLRRLTFYTLNRAFLLAGIVFSATYPAVNLSSFFQRHQQLATRVIYYWQPAQVVVAPVSFTIWDALTILFWAGAIVMFIRFMLQLISLKYIHRKSTRSFIKGQWVRTTAENIDPFSFFNHIYLNPSASTLSELDNILKHEAVHVRQWHTLDVLAVEVNTIFYWFNPGAWLMKNAVKQNLEYIADRKVLGSGADSTAYQYNLVNATVTKRSPKLANNFNLAHLKNRIMMMNKKKSSRINLLKYLLLLPLVLLVLIFTISNAEVKKTTNNKTAYDYETTVKTDSIPGSPAKTVIKIDSGKSVQVVRIKNGNSHVIRVNNNNDSTLTNIQITDVQDPEVIRKDSVVTITIEDNDTVNAPTKVFTIVSDNVHDSAYVVSGNTRSKGFVYSSNRTMAIANVQENSPKSVYVVSSDGIDNAQANADTTPINVIILQDTTIMTGNKHPLYIVDGKIVSSIKSIPAEKIKSINILKGDQAITQYGEKAKNGVIIVTLKKEKN